MASQGSLPTNKMLRHNLCVMCLSHDRTLYSLQTCFEVFNSCKPLFTQHDFDEGKHQICWECKANLARIAAFKVRVDKAQEVLSLLNSKQKMQIIIKKLTNLKISSMCITTTKKSNSKVVRKDKITVSTKSLNVKKEKGSDDVDKKYIKADPNGRFEYIHINDVKRDDVSEKSVDVKDEPLTKTIKNDDNVQDDDDSTALANIKDDGGDEDGFKSLNKSNKKHIPNLRFEDVCVVQTLTHEEVKKYREEKRNSEEFKKAPFKCTDCLMTFDLESEHANHALLHTEEFGDFSCSICHLRLPSKAFLAEHKRDHYSIYQCRVCRFKCRERAAFERHCDRNHRPRRCKKCNITFSTISQARCHLRKVHRAKLNCPLCLKQLANTTSMRAHMKIHEGLPLLECDVCHKKYRGAYGLRTHRRIMHTQKDAGDDAFCVECGVKFKNVNCYKAHLKLSNKHAAPEEFKYECTECNRKFTQRRTLRNHISAIHRKEVTHYCHECDKGFCLKSSWKRHQLLVHEGVQPPRNKLCVVCGKAFMKIVSLQQHMNTHTGERPYQCNLCPATFGFSASLYTHTRLVHNKLERPFKAKGQKKRSFTSESSS